jgi:hypothetical protein
MQKRSLADAFPELAAQAVGWDPTTVAFGSVKRKLWRCVRGHEWGATVDNRTTGTGCPFCSGHLPIAGETDLATTQPGLAAEAVGWDPRAVSAGSHKKVLWRCAAGHEYVAQVSDRAKTNGTGCPFCSNQRVLSGYNDLATTHVIADRKGAREPLAPQRRDLRVAAAPSRPADHLGRRVPAWQRDDLRPHSGAGAVVVRGPSSM